jgi:hypothetical protein
MGFPANLRVRDRMHAIGAAGEDTIFVINHFSHNGGMNHAELANMARPEGFVVAWDGMEAQPQYPVVRPHSAKNIPRFGPPIPRKNAASCGRRLSGPYFSR